jgi:hypothetical protein
MWQYQQRLLPVCKSLPQPLYYILVIVKMETLYASLPTSSVLGVEWSIQGLGKQGSIAWGLGMERGAPAGDNKELEKQQQDFGIFLSFKKDKEERHGS